MRHFLVAGAASPQSPIAVFVPKRVRFLEEQALLLLAACCRGLWLGSAWAVLPLSCQVRYRGWVLISLSHELIM